MNDIDEKALDRHIRGATVLHQSPFNSIEVPSAEEALSARECEKWVVPFYRVSFCSAEGGFANSLRSIYKEITPAVVERLLTEYNWRPRLTGAFFAALRHLTPVEDHIGRLLVRSDLCYAGKLYCVALAEFNTPVGLEYLRRYLMYYLTRPDLDFDQDDAMGAIAWLDGQNGTRMYESFLPLWQTFVDAKSWKPNLEKSVALFADEMRALREFRAKAEIWS